MKTASSLNGLFSVCAIPLSLLLSVSAGAGVFSVNPGQSIQAAIDAAADGDQIEVAPGTYTGTMDFKGKAVRLYSTGGPEVTTLDGLPDYVKNFDDGNSDGWQIVDEGNWNTPSDWVVLNGTMVQRSNIYTEPKSDERYLGTYALSPKSFDWDFYSISLTVKSDDNDAMGVMFCYQDAANYYRFSMDSERKFRRLVKCVNGVFSTLYEDSVAYVIGQSYRIRIDPGLYGTGLFVDDVFLSNVSDTTFQGGPIALYCWGNSGTYFDDVSVQPHWTSPYNIVQCVSGETADTVLEGFTVTQSAWGFVPTALFLQDSSPTIRNCIFRDCDSQAGGSMATGGGILNRNGNLTVFGCTFINNIPHIDSEDGTVQISDGSFSGWNGSIQLRNSDTTIARCSFEIGGIAANDSDIVVSDCSFSSCNWPLHSYNCNLGVTNCTFSFGEYGAITNDYCSAVVTNCTFAHNRPYSPDYYGGGGAILNTAGNAVVTNCIFLDNGENPVHDREGGSSTVTYSNVDDPLLTDEGNIHTPPCFVDSANGDFRLQWYSPSIDAGNNAAIPAGVTTDIGGYPRVINGDADDIATVDMGACEFGGAGLGVSLQITIEPQEAVDAGAAWRIAGEAAWHTSGQIISPTAGLHEIQFKELDGWFEPDGMKACVMRDVPCTKTVAYKSVGTFAIGQIPSGDVPHKATYAFYVRSASLGPDAVLGMTAEPGPVGAITFDPESGLFVYHPDDISDKLPFNVTFTATSNGQVEEQTIVVSPIPDLPAESTLVSRPMQSFPDSESRDYLFVNEVESQTNEMLNGLSRKVRSITIAGKTVVFEANHPNDLYEDYNNPQDGPVVSDIKEMTIYAETLIIADRLHLPQTNLTIYARRLQFEGSDALLCTTPHDDRPSSPTPLPGLDAGNITLYVESYSSEEGAIPFLLDGSAGHSGGGAGKPGHLTCTLDKMRPLAWLTPYSVKMILSHARDAYLYGYTAEADDILADYREQITAFMGLETWDSLDPQWQLELEQMFGEIVTLSHRLENGLDYFGNPPGWVPMLSFEVTKAFYEQEIHRTIRVLYLSYWLQNKATAISDKAAALSSSRQAMWGQTQEFADQYAQIQTLIPKLKNDAEQIALRIGYLLGDLQRKEDELMALADRIVQKRHEVPWWKDMLNGLGTIVTSTIEGAAEGGKKGAIEGGIKGTLNVLKDRLFSEPEPWPVITNRIGVDREFNRIDFAAATGEWLDQFSAIPDTLNLIEQNGADSYLQNLREQAASMAGGMNQIKEALKATSLSNEEVETELKAIKAKDPIFNSLVDQVTQLAVEKEVFNRQLSTAMQKVSTLASGITNNLLAIDGMNRDASHLNRVVDPRAALYVKDMERRALERLQKYHYYLARSYEYRLLEPSPMDLNIGKMFTAMETIVSAQGELDAAEFTNLKTIYEEQLWNLTDQIYRDYQENISSEATAPVRLDLSSEQIAALNAGTKVVIDLKNAARFQYNEENLRIVDVQVDRMEFHVEGTYDLQDYFDFEIEHGGVSTLQKDGQMYRFVHYKDVERENNPINWNQRHFADGQWYPVDRSDASQSLLFSLLENCPNAGTGDILLYARPAAWADLILRKIPNEQNSGQLVIDHVRLLIRYDRILRPTQFSALQIVTQPQDLFAYFTVNQPDRYQRQDGVGEFNRTYSTGTTVQATAPLQSGNYAFVKWTDGSGNEVSQNAALSLKLNANTKRIAQYAYTGPTLSVADFNEDSIVDMTDFLGLSNAWLTQPGDADWNPAYDISDPQDQVIDILDLTALADAWLRY